MKYFSIIFTSISLIVFTSTSTAQTNWTKYPGNPVLIPGLTNSWEEDEVFASFVLKDADTLKMWYSGLKNDNSQIGYATSFDGILWQRYPANPVLHVGAPGSWDSQRILFPRIIIIDTTYHMWYGGSDNPSYYSFRGGYATSPDGINWTKDTLNNPIIDLGNPGEWDSATLSGHSVFFDGDTFHAWYSGCDNPNWENSRIGYGTSIDGINWTKYPGNPVFSGSGSWDSLGVFGPSVIVDGSGYKMWYYGYDGYYERVGYATSHDGVNWAASGSFVLDVGNPGTWDDKYIVQPNVLLDDTTYYMWYSGRRANTGRRIGYATAPVTGLEQVKSEHYPERFILKQNYPNPFNPKTVISYQLKKTASIELSIYDLLGQKLTTLLNEKQFAGTYRIEWDASEFSSGVYIYRLETSTGFMQSRKLVLLK